MHRPLYLLLCSLFLFVPIAALSAEEPAKTAAKPLDQAALFKKFSDSMNNVKLVGNFTVLGKDPGKLSKEEYTILGVTKQEEGDKWLLKTRIKYGQHDVVVPLSIDIKWAGDTPMISLTDFTIPGLGTFSSRVLFYENTYAGTWTHGKVSGHLFGTIEKNKAEEGATEKPAK